jgi:hypothetical protein
MYEYIRNLNSKTNRSTVMFDTTEDDREFENV